MWDAGLRMGSFSESRRKRTQAADSQAEGFKLPIRLLTLYFLKVHPGGILQGVSFLLPIEFDLAATFLAALTGVWAASRRGYDLVGAFMLAIVTGVGGGLLRDAVFIAQMPVVMQDARYLWA